MDAGAFERDFRNTEFTPVNREIKKRVFRKEVISQTAYQKYRIFQPQIKHTLMKMKQDLLPVLKRKKTHILRYQYIGKRLDMAHLWNPEKEFFRPKSLLKTWIQRLDFYWTSLVPLTANGGKPLC